ncbi:DUF6904 family protein [Halomonas sp. C05BenzN]|uniref:DUF6904 family protein n=1 Tax=Halomonas sp. C05BenzN TaxID=3411041 RepID=UPI003B93BC6B
MLHYKTLKNHAGLLLCGDYLTLRQFHEVVHEIEDRSPLMSTSENVLLTLAYDIRKAYEKRRVTLKPPENYPEIGPRFGVEVLWPVLLLQCRLLRASLAFFDNTKRQQSMVYLLEDVVQQGLASDFGDKASKITESVERLGQGYDHVQQCLDSRGAMFCAWTKKQRRDGLACLMQSFDPMYLSLYPLWLRAGATHLIPPEEFALYEDAEWQDPRW